MSEPILEPEASSDATFVETESTPTRRAFVGAAAAAGLCYAGAIGYPIYRYLASPAEMAASESAVREVTLDKAQELPENSALMFKFGSSPAMLIHGKDDSWVAFSAVCTHLGCTVKIRAGTEPYSLLMPRRRV